MTYTKVIDLGTKFIIKGLSLSEAGAQLAKGPPYFVHMLFTILCRRFLIVFKLFLCSIP